MVVPWTPVTGGPRHPTRALELTEFRWDSGSYQDLILLNLLVRPLTFAVLQPRVRICYHSTGQCARLARVRRAHGWWGSYVSRMSTQLTTPKMDEYILL